MLEDNQSRATPRSVGRTIQTGLGIASIVAVTTGVVGGLYKVNVAVERLIITIEKDSQATDRWRASVEHQARRNLQLHETMAAAIVEHSHQLDTIERRNSNNR